MPRGRPPKPTHLKVLLGNPGKRALNADEPKPSAAPPACPPWLDAYAKRVWKSLLPELERLGLLTSVDGQSFACYCQAVAECKQATERLRQEGRYIVVGGYPEYVGGEGEEKKLVIKGGQQQPHPAVAQQRSAWKAIREFSSLFGLDPSSRSRMKVSGGGEAGDEFDEFLKRNA